MYLPAAEIAIVRIASAPTDVNTTTAECTTVTRAPRAAGAVRLIAVIWVVVGLTVILVAMTIVITATRATVIATTTGRITALPAVTRRIIWANEGGASRALLLTSYDVMFVNALSTEDVVAGIKHLWEDALANCGLTELALHTRAVVSEVIPQVWLCWIWVYKGWLLSEDTEALRIRPMVEWPECIFGTGCWAPSKRLWRSRRQWLAPIDG
jgi:hypothetical protein